MGSHTRPRGRPAHAHAEYRRIADDLRGRIESGEWPADRAIPPLRNLAEAYAVSRITVRGAVELLKREGRIERGEGRRLFVKDPHGVPLATERLVALVASGYLDHNLRQRYGRQILNGLELGVTDQARSLLLAHHWKFLYAMPSRLEKLPLTGLLLWGHFRKEVLRDFARLPVPIVLVDKPRLKRPMHAASVANEQAAYEATQRLIGLGHRRIAFLRQILLLSREADPDSLERQRGYEQALRAAGLRVDGRLIVNSLANDTAQSASVQSLFGPRNRVTAILAVDAGKARLVQEAARVRGVRIPADMSLACFQEKDPPHPELSGPRTDFEALGLAAAQLLRKPKKPFEEARVPATWAEGSTVAAR